MSFSETILIAISSLRANRLRSLLTLLGIVIGVMTVIAVVSIIAGLNDYVASRIFNLGPDVITISRTEPVIASFEQWLENEKRKNLYLPDMDAIREACIHCRSVGASLSSRARVKSGRDYVDSRISGHTAEVAGILGQELQSGRFFTEYDVEHSRNVAVIGSDVAETLFPFADPIGKTVMIDNRPFDIVGVGVKQGSVLGETRDNWVTIPFSIHQKMWGARQSIQIYAKAIDETQLPAAMDEVRLRLRARRHVAYKDEDDFSLNTSETFLQIWEDISQAFFAVTIGIAGMSVLVGGIVVMNIMLVSVTERTREIGIRKAAGARRKDILQQFLVESAMLAMAGGILGIILGAAIAGAISWFSPLPATIKWWSVGLGLTVSTTVGLFFGIYPAKRAANLDPITALRYE
jgi:putative ABC transport system permease protein